MASDYTPGSVTLDSETGEVDQTVICLRSTSLTCHDCNPPRTRETHTDRTRFKVPTGYTKPVKVHRDVRINGVDLTVLNSSTLLPIACVLPPLLLFPAWAGIMIALSEASIHIWSHRKNRLITDEDAKFRSPFNLITSEFCAKCRTEKWMRQISKIQDKRSSRRNLIDPAFIKQVIR